MNTPTFLLECETSRDFFRAIQRVDEEFEAKCDAIVAKHTREADDDDVRYELFEIIGGALGSERVITLSDSSTGGMLVGEIADLYRDNPYVTNGEDVYIGLTEQMPWLDDDGNLYVDDDGAHVWESTGTCIANETIEGEADGGPMKSCWGMTAYVGDAAKRASYWIVLGGRSRIIPIGGAHGSEQSMNGKNLRAKYRHMGGAGKKASYVA